MSLEDGALLPEVTVVNRQRTVQPGLDRLRRLAQQAGGLCVVWPGCHKPMLRALDAVEISLVSDPVIARIHRRFMNVRGATDVITFPHGEIIVSAATAAREAVKHAQPTDREILRYIVHGLLHLNGHEDKAADESAAMWAAQEAIVDRLWMLS